MWKVYLVECADGTYYCGISKDIDRRLHAHNHTKKGAKYTRTRRPVRLIASSKSMSHGDALRLERQIKKLPREKKAYFLDT